MFQYCVAYSVYPQPSNHVLENFVRISRTPKPQGRYTPPREHPVTLFNIPQRNINTTIKIPRHTCTSVQPDIPHISGELHDKYIDHAKP